MAVAWRTDHPENRYEDMSLSNTEYGDYLSVLCAIVHPDYEFKGILTILYALALERFNGIKRVFWTAHARDSKRLIITDASKLAEVMVKWQKIKSRKSKQKV